MPADPAKPFAFNEDAAKRTIASVRDYEANQLAQGASLGRNNTGLQCIIATLTSRDTSDKGKYAWSQVVRTDTTWTTQGLTGTVDDRPAFFPDVAASDTDAADLSGHRAILARGTYQNADDKWKPCWYVTGLVSLVKVGTKKYQVWQMLTDEIAGTPPTPGTTVWDWVRAHGS